MKTAAIVGAAAVLLAGCVVVVPIPVSVPVSTTASSSQGTKSVPMRNAPSGSVAAVFGRKLNAERRARGLRPLSHNPLIDTVATRHARDMQSQGRLTHTGANGKSAHQRLKAAGYRPCRSAENIAEGFPRAETVFAQFMNSPGHRKNNLLPDVAEFGVGHAPEQNYWVLMVARSGC